MLGTLDFSVSEHWVGSVSSLGSLDTPVVLGWGVYRWRIATPSHPTLETEPKYWSHTVRDFFLLLCFLLSIPPENF